MSPKTAGLPENVVTPQDMSALLLDIRRYNQWYQSEVIKQRTNVNTPSPAPSVSETASELLRTYAPDGHMSSETLTALITWLEHIKKTAPTITITLADLPSAPLKRELASWCRNNLAPIMLIQFNCNRRILGGMVVRYGSRMFDWSFRTKLLANKAAIPEVMRRV